ncbi:MAG: hypothetical protein SPH82_10270 [Eubacteriales bacterium]|nr:hypothetical protein [Eubacteriales bacterium]
MKNESKKKSALLTPRSVLCILIVLLYAVGLVLMLVGSFTAGASMWAVSTIAGALVLVVKYYQEKRAADEARVEEEEREYQQKLKDEAKGEQN